MPRRSRRSNVRVKARSNGRSCLALVQIGAPAEKVVIVMDTLSIEQDSIPDGRRRGIFEPGNGEIELPLANAVHQLDA